MVRKLQEWMNRGVRCIDFVVYFFKRETQAPSVYFGTRVMQNYILQDTGILIFFNIYIFLYIYIYIYIYIYKIIV